MLKNTHSISSKNINNKSCSPKRFSTSSTSRQITSTTNQPTHFVPNSTLTPSSLHLHRKMSTTVLPHHKKLLRRTQFQKDRAYDDTKLLSFIAGSTTDGNNVPLEYKATGLTFHVLSTSQSTSQYIQSKLPAPKPKDSLTNDNSDDSDDEVKNKLTTVHFITKSQLKSFSNEALSKLFPSVNWDISKSIIKANKFIGKEDQKITLINSLSEDPVLLVGLGDVIDGVSYADDHLNLRSFGHLIHSITQHIKDTLQTSAIHFYLPDLHFTKQFKVAHGAGNGVIDKEDDDELDDTQLAAKKQKDAADKKNKKIVEHVEPKDETHRVAIDDVVDTTIRYTTCANHVFDKYLSPDAAKEKNFPLETVFITVPRSLTKPLQNIINAINLAESEVLARELGNERSNIADPSYMQKKCEELVTAHSDCLTLRMYQTDELESLGYGLLPSVGKGSNKQHAARVAVMEYTPQDFDTTERPLALVGKTVTFDTGGLCLKPGKYMLEMWQDKLGGVHTLAVMRALALNKPKTGRKIICALGIAENAIGENAIHPNAIILDGNGQTVEIIDTDAEGRNLLATTLSVVQNHHGATDLVTMATLTGSVMVALGTYAAGIFTNDPSKASKMIQIGLDHDELYWQMPIFPHHHKNLKGGLHTDLIHCTSASLSDASNAAAFLESFIKPKNTFMHLDIAGVAALDSAQGTKPAGATGDGVTSVYKFITQNAKQ